MGKIILNDINTYNLKKMSLNGREANFYLDEEKNLLYKLYKPLPFKKSDVIYLTNLREQKVKILSERKDLEDKLVLPCDIVYDEYDMFKGYTMQYYKDSIGLEKYFSNEKLDKNVIYDFYIKISKYFEFFHEHEIYLPDFNLRNVLLLKDKLMLCDGDSYKIKDLPATMNSSLLIAHYHSKNKQIVENANLDKELLIMLMLKDLYDFNMGMLKEKEFHKKLNNLEHKFEFTKEEIEQFKMLKQTNESLLYPHEFMQPVKKKIKSSFWF